MRIKRLEKRAASLVAIACVMVVALATPASAATLVGDYQFQDSLGNSSGTAASLTEFSWYGATGTFGSDDVFGTTRTVWNFPEGNGLVLNGAKNYMGNFYSIVMLVKLNEITDYRKLVDFRHSSGTDAGLYILNSNLTAYGCGASSTSNPISSGTYHQIVMTRDTSKKIRLYVDGTQVASGDDLSDGCSFGSGETIHFLVDDEYTCSSTDTSCEQGSGAIARLRIYNGALTAAEVSRLDRIPGEEPPEGMEHARSVTLALKKHLIATGSVTVEDGMLECYQNVTVSIQKKTPSGFKTIKNAVTTTSGTFKTRIPDKKGVYRSKVALVSAGGTDTCGADTSPTKRHSH